jgi:hypothetical protein
MQLRKLLEPYPQSFCTSNIDLVVDNLHFYRSQGRRRRSRDHAPIQGIKVAIMAGADDLPEARVPLDYAGEMGAHGGIGPEPVLGVDDQRRIPPETDGFT